MGDERPGMLYEADAMAEALDTGHSLRRALLLQAKQLAAGEGRTLVTAADVRACLPGVLAEMLRDSQAQPAEAGSVHASAGRTPR